ncbi:hypothetical protein Bca52824_048339 [Brassica carinata]|uniref:Uncharacterized protein n=1 Tax=Brassica carinata TaxID=52824 RepID=A0A8X7UQT5_BRACI|nr:hypothetical protein Bca52824_048339 [Brassica carinata]
MHQQDVVLSSDLSTINITRYWNGDNWCVLRGQKLLPSSWRLHIVTRSGAEECFNHLGVLHVQVISCSLYGDDDTWKAWLDVDNSMLHNYYYFYNL